MIHYKCTRPAACIKNELFSTRPKTYIKNTLFCTRPAANFNNACQPLMLDAKFAMRCCLKVHFIGHINTKDY